jgi:hypothetical protein
MEGTLGPRRRIFTHRRRRGRGIALNAAAIGAVLLLVVALGLPVALGQERVAVRIGNHDGYDRAVFDWPKSIDYDVQADGRGVKVVFDQASELDIAPMLRKFGAAASELKASREDGKAVLSFTLPPRVQLRHFRNDNSIVLDFVRAGARAPVLDPASTRQLAEEKSAKLSGASAAAPATPAQIVPPPPPGGAPTPTADAQAAPPPPAVATPPVLPPPPSATLPPPPASAAAPPTPPQREPPPTAVAPPPATAAAPPPPPAASASSAPAPASTAPRGAAPVPLTPPAAPPAVQTPPTAAAPPSAAAVPPASTPATPAPASTEKPAPTLTVGPLPVRDECRRSDGRRSRAERRRLPPALSFEGADAACDVHARRRCVDRPRAPPDARCRRRSRRASARLGPSDVDLDRDARLRDDPASRAADALERRRVARRRYLDRRDRAASRRAACGPSSPRSAAIPTAPAAASSWTCPGVRNVLRLKDAEANDELLVAPTLSHGVAVAVMQAVPGVPRDAVRPGPRRPSAIRPRARQARSATRRRDHRHDAAGGAGHGRRWTPPRRPAVRSCSIIEAWRGKARRPSTSASRRCIARSRRRRRRSAAPNAWRSRSSCSPTASQSRRSVSCVRSRPRRRGWPPHRPCARCAVPRRCSPTTSTMPIAASPSRRWRSATRRRCGAASCACARRTWRRRASSRCAGSNSPSAIRRRSGPRSRWRSRRRRSPAGTNDDAARFLDLAAAPAARASPTSASSRCCAAASSRGRATFPARIAAWKPLEEGGPSPTRAEAIARARSRR